MGSTKLHNLHVRMSLFCKQIDKEGANPQTVLQELSTHGLMPEEWGGDVPMVQVRMFVPASLSSSFGSLLLNLRC